MTDPTFDHRSVEHPRQSGKWRRVRLPTVDFVLVMLAILAAVILLFLTAELWLPHVQG